MPCGRHRSDGSHPKHPPEHLHLEGSRGRRHQRQQGVVRVGFVRTASARRSRLPIQAAKPSSPSPDTRGVKTTKCTGARHSAWLASIRGTSATKRSAIQLTGAQTSAAQPTLAATRAGPLRRHQGGAADAQRQEMRGAGQEDPRGCPPEQAVSRDALRNPDALVPFLNWEARADA